MLRYPLRRRGGMISVFPAPLFVIYLLIRQGMLRLTLPED